MNLKISEFSGSSALAEQESVVKVYGAVYSLPPYNEPLSRIQEFANSWEGRTMKSGFLFVGAKDTNDQLKGFAYGWPSVSGDSWNTKISAQLGDSATKWLSDCFEFYDLAVS